MQVAERVRCRQPLADWDVDQFAAAVTASWSGPVLGPDQGQYVAEVDDEGVTLDRPDLDHLVTPTMKSKRNELLAYFKNEIEQLYQFIE